MSMRLVDDHLFSIFCACNAMCEVLDVLPKTDLTEELKDLAHTQHELCMTLIEGKHYGTDNLEDFIDFTNEVTEEIARIKDIHRT